MSKGTLYIISAPSGAGKSSLVSALLENYTQYNIQVSISHTTRRMRSKEKNTVHYHFIEEYEFRELIKQGAFLEHAEVFGNLYGTSRVWVEKMLLKGTNILLNIDWQGARQVKEKVPEVKTIFILPPSKEELERRLSYRGQDSTEVINKRMNEAWYDISHYKEYDYVIVNNDFCTALMDLEAIIRSEQLKTKRKVGEYQLMFSEFLEK